MGTSIIVVTYNHAAIVGDCLRAVLSTVPPDTEVIVVDNASTDGTAERVRRDFPGVRVVEAPRNLGYGGGNNLGAARAHGEHLVFLNPDARPRGGWLEPLLAGLEGDQTAGLATAKLVLARDESRIDTMGNDVHLSGITPSRLWGEPAAAHNTVEEVSAISGACFAVRRARFAELGGFDERYFLYYEDTDLSLRARLAGYRCLAIPNSEVVHDHRPGFAPPKLRYLERNRYWTLLKVFQVRTLLALLPALALAELLAWAMAVRSGPQHVVAKTLAWLDLLRWLPDLRAVRRATQRARRVSDAELLRLHSTTLRFGQTAAGPLAATAERTVAAAFGAARVVAGAIVRRSDAVLDRSEPASGALRIAHVTATFPPYGGGAGNVAWYSAREQARRGHEAHVYTAASAGGGSGGTSWTAWSDPGGVAVHRLGPVVQVGNAPLLLQLPLALRGFDVIHLHYPFIFGAELVAAAALITGTPLVITYHNDLVADSIRGALFRVYAATVGRWALRRAEAILAVSAEHLAQSRARDAPAWPGTRVAEVPNGVDIERFRPDHAAGAALRRSHGIADDLPLVAFVGTLDPAHHYRRLDLLLDALATLRKAGTRCGLVVAGDGAWRTRYETHAVRAGLTDVVWFLGAVGHDHLRDVYSAADVLALPSERQESFGMVVIESLACGTPVVASDLPGVRSVVLATGGGALVPPGCASALAEAIGALLTDEPRRRAMGDAGRRVVVERFSWPAVAARIESAYRDAIAQRCRPAALAAAR